MATQLLTASASLSISLLQRPLLHFACRKLPCSLHGPHATRSGSQASDCIIHLPVPIDFVAAVCQSLEMSGCPRTYAEI